MQCIKQTTTNCYMTLLKLFKSISLYIFCPKVIQFHLHTLIKIQNTATLYPNPPISISPFNWCQKTSDTLTKKKKKKDHAILLLFSLVFFQVVSAPLPWLYSHSLQCYPTWQCPGHTLTPVPNPQFCSPKYSDGTHTNSEWKKSFTLLTLSLGKQHFSEESLD